jgi:hypothetical protein
MEGSFGIRTVDSVEALLRLSSVPVWEEQARANATAVSAPLQAASSAAARAAGVTSVSFSQEPSTITAALAIRSRLVEVGLRNGFLSACHPAFTAHRSTSLL